MVSYKNLKIGLLGGTFDPPHCGHIKLATHFCQLLNFDQLLLIPSGQPWQKTRAITEVKHRLAMTELAADVIRQDCPNTQVMLNTLEIERAGPSYAIDTVKVLREQYGPLASLTWLMGYDQLLHLETWHQWQNLLDFVNFAVATRPGYEAEALSATLLNLLSNRQTSAALLQSRPSGQILLDTQLAENISSTQLRQLFVHDAANSVKMPQAVIQYINQHQLYRLTKEANDGH